MGKNLPKFFLLSVSQVVSAVLVLIGVALLFVPSSFSSLLIPFSFIIFGLVNITAIQTLSNKMKQFESAQQLSLHKLLDENEQSKQQIISLTAKLDESDQKLFEFDQSRSWLLRLLNELRAQQQVTEKIKAKDEAILASIGDGVVTIDKNGDIDFFNNAATKMTNWTQAEIFGRSWFETVPALDPQGKIISREERDIDKAMSSGQKVFSLATFLQKGTGKFPVSMTATPILLNDEIIGAVGIFRDITHEQEVDRMKTEFISLASHQLRTPLSAIKWFAELLSDSNSGNFTVEQNEFVQNISLSTQRMIELVNSLLNISRIESGRIIIDPQPTSMKELVDGVLSELQNKITEKKHNLEFLIEENIPKIAIDPKLIRQVYMNLLTNAIKYTPSPGTITIHIFKNNIDVVTDVSDNGLGIPDAQKKKIFQKFFRAENVIGAETDGTGLGLYLVKSVVESSGGKIWFNSVQGKGTTFSFTLPLVGTKAKPGEVTLDV